MNGGVIKDSRIEVVSKCESRARPILSRTQSCKRQVERGNKVETPSAVPVNRVNLLITLMSIPEISGTSVSQNEERWRK